MTQRERVLALLREARECGVCAETMYATGLPNGRNRIGELRAEGWHIESAPCRDEHGPGYYRYVLLHGPREVCPACRPGPAQMRLIG